MDYEQYVAGVSFRLVKPDAGRDGSNRFALDRATAVQPRLLELPYTPFDVHNTALPGTNAERLLALRKLCQIPRMSTIGIGALLNMAVARMPAGQAFVNVGVWNGFTLLSGMECNPGKLCIGVDNFSEGPGDRTRRALAERFERYASAERRFHEMDYRDYFRNVHDGPIGVYLYDGEHGYENQLLGLEIAEPFLAPGCIVMVDDTNWSAPHEATLDFMQSSRHKWRLLLDSATGSNAHPTYSNGLMVLQMTEPDKRGAPAGRRDASTIPAKNVRRPSPVTVPPPLARRDGTPLVSVVIVNESERAEGLEQAIEGYLQGQWPDVEVLVADEHPGEPSRAAVSAFGSVPHVTAAGGVPALERAVAASTGDYVGIAEAGRPVRPDAVRQALAFPSQTGRGRELPPDRWEWMERALRASDDMCSVVPEGETYALVNDRLWSADVIAGRPRMPFPAKDRDYAGRPAGDESAISELERARLSGLGFLAFAWPAFWWLEHYAGLDHHLRTAYRCALENDRIVVFDLRT